MMATVSFQTSISWERMPTPKKHDLTSRERRTTVLCPCFLGVGPGRGNYYLTEAILILLGTSNKI